MFIIFPFNKQIIIHFIVEFSFGREKHFRLLFPDVLQYIHEMYTTALFVCKLEILKFSTEGSELNREANDEMQFEIQCFFAEVKC